MKRHFHEGKPWSDGRQATLCGRLADPRKHGVVCLRCMQVQAERDYNAEIRAEQARRAASPKERV
jgi:hypothetical protein